MCAACGEAQPTVKKAIKAAKCQFCESTDRLKRPQYTEEGKNEVIQEQQRFSFASSSFRDYFTVGSHSTEGGERPKEKVGENYTVIAAGANEKSNGEKISEPISGSKHERVSPGSASDRTVSRIGKIELSSISYPNWIIN